VGGAIGDGSDGFSLTKAGTGTLALVAGANTYTGHHRQRRYAAVGRWHFGHDGALATRRHHPRRLGRKPAFNTFGTITQSAVVSGNGSVTKSGTGTVILNSANNPYSGATSFNGGTLQLGDGTSGMNSPLATSSVSLAVSGASYHLILLERLSLPAAIPAAAV